MRNDARPASHIWFASCVCGLAAAIVSSVPFFLSSYGLAACIIWSAVYFVTACVSGEIFLSTNRRDAYPRPDAVLLCFAMVVGALITSSIVACPFFLNTLTLVGCIVWLAGFVGGFIYTARVFVRPN